MKEIQVIKSIDELKVLANPHRIQILRMLIEEPRTVKEISIELNKPQNKIHYHINLLRDAGFVSIKEERRKRNLTEKVYQAKAKFYIVDWGIFDKTTEASNAFAKTLSTVLETGLLELQTAIRKGYITQDTVKFAIPLNTVLTVKEENLPALRKKFEEFLKSIREFSDEESRGCKVHLTLLLFPIFETRR